MILDSVWGGVGDIARFFLCMVGFLGFSRLPHSWHAGVGSPYVLMTIKVFCDIADVSFGSGLSRDAPPSRPYVSEAARHTYLLARVIGLFKA